MGFVPLTEDKPIGTTTGRFVPLDDSLKKKKRYAVPTEEPGYSDSSPKSWEDFTAGEAMWYASKLGLLDTYRGGKQLLNIDEEDMAKDQKILNELMQHPDYGGRVTAAYFGGMIADPVGWFIPATKARTAAKMAKHGLMWGGIGGAAGYVDPEMESLVGEGKLGRTEQAVMGAAGGSVLSPFMGKMIQLGKKGYAPVGEKVWKAISKNPEVGGGLVGSVWGYNVGEDTTVEEDLSNALKGALIGVGSGLGARGFNKATKGALGRFIIPEFGLTPDYLMLKGINRRDSNKIARQFNDIVKKFQAEKPEARERIYRVLTGEIDLDDPIGKMAANKGWTLKNVGKARPDFDENPRPDQMAFARHKEKTIYFDPLLARQKFDIKAWRTPTKEGVTPLDDALFPTYRDWENFVKTHEVLHITKKILPGESAGDYENRINQLAIKQLQLNPIHIPLQKLVDEARDVMDKYGKELVDLGVLHPQTFEKNRATYMHRMFKNPDYHLEKSKFQFIRGADEIRSIGDELRLRGRPETLTGEEWEYNRDFYLNPENGFDVIGIRFKNDDILTHLDDEMLEKLRTKKIKGVEQAADIHAGSIKEITVRRDWTPEEKAAMNEVTDAAIALNRTGQLMANDVSALRFYKTVAEDYAWKPKLRHDFKKDPPPEGYSKTAIPNNKARYGDLAGAYLPKDIYHDIYAMDKWRSGEMFKHPLMKAFRGLTSWWKLTKTAYNAPVHTSNFASNIAMYDFNGGSMKGLRQAFNDLLFPSKRGESERLKLARIHDVFGGNYIGNEVLNKNKDLYMAYGNALNTGEEVVDKMINHLPDTILKVGKKFKRGTLDQAKDLYTWEDSLFRFGLFNTLVDAGVNPVIAARQARQGFVDYERSSPLLEVLRNTAIPFAAYGYGIVPRIAESMAKRPWKFAKWAGIIAGINAIGEDLTNDPEKITRERQLMGSDQDRRLLDLPSFMSPTTTIKVPPQLNPPGAGGMEESRYLNLARMFPGQFAGYTSQGYKVPGLPDVLQPSFGAVGGAMFPAMGINPFMGAEIPEGDRLKETVRQFTPNLPVPLTPLGLAPGSGTYAGTKMERAMVPGGFVSRTKENHTLITATLQNLGIRLQTVDIQKLGDQNYWRLKKKQDTLLKKLRDLDTALLDRLYEGKEKLYQKKQTKLYEELRKLDKTMSDLGI